MVLLTVTWADAQSGQSAHHCVDSCRTLGYALGHLGVATELRAAGVVMHHQRTGMTTSCAPVMPSWRNRNELDGHCLLTIPDQGRYIDATIEQFPGMSQLRAGPAVGRFGALPDPTTGEISDVGDLMGRPPAGTSIALPRGDRVLVYTLSPDAGSKVITEHPTVTTFAA
ncbi:hypothetical protein [Actinomadura opuntiae]|uniref:hypothetical protein n=1 Tax=Actinomadura sp. OS1-43 TaxID=604315 RepID=UPI00255ABD9D|nr:hypothetical protein [Actinomadura sp. OS1-43]MDL4818677.1 hypothetical protein [Actinomadura sp. OS1-43]